MVEARTRAGADNREGLRRNRGDERPERVALVVEVAPVDEDDVLGQSQEPLDELRKRRREAEVDERLRHAAPLDAEGAVAGHAGDDSLARIDDPQVVEAGNVDAV